MRRLALAILLLVTVRVDAALTKSDLQAWLDQALAAANEVPPELRRDAAYAIDLGRGRSTQQVQAALLKIALRPSSPGWWDLMWAIQPAEKELVLEFLEAAYRARAGVESEASREWQQGLAEMLFCTGRFDEALRLQRQVMAAGSTANTAYGSILLAMMENVGGDHEAYARLAADPPVPNASTQKPALYMQSVVQSVGKRMMQMLPPSRVPPQVPAMMTSSPDWESRITGAVRVSENDPMTGDRELAKVLADPAAPEWVVNDALFATAQLPNLSSKAPARVISALECWLARQRIVIPAAGPEMWQRLRELPATAGQETWIRSRTRACYHLHNGGPPPECLLAAAALYMMASTNGRDFEAARRSIEWAAALSLEHGRGLNNLGLYLALAAEAAPTPEERARILRYAASLPAQKYLHTGMGEEVAEAVRAQTEKSVAAPWSTPVAAASPKCP